VGDLVTLVGMFPEPSHVLDELPLVVDQHFVDSNGPAIGVAAAAVPLEPLQPLLDEGFWGSVRLGQDPAEAGLVGTLGKTRG